ncbi:hypothetical protein [Segatella buccae]|uniref:hypothetical protein n=1 Tax=Segatella buccae TaxID=28126 RepID=UPI0013649B53|nr:hypothetical protein [Segatella buccae]
MEILSAPATWGRFASRGRPDCRPSCRVRFCAGCLHHPCRGFARRVQQLCKAGAAAMHQSVGKGVGGRSGRQAMPPSAIGAGEN